MHNRYLRLAVGCLACLGCTGVWVSATFAQTTTPAPAPATAPPAAVPAEPAPAVVPPPAGVEPAPPAAASPTAPAEAVPPGPPPTTPPPPPPGEPLPPQYGRLGGQEEIQAPKGEWNPWDHPDATGGRTHDGFFLRLQLGPGGSSVSREGQSWSGVGLGMGLAIGGSPMENLALHLDLQTTWMFSPDRDVNGIGMQSLGIGVTYYIMPVDIFLSGAVGIGALAFEDESGQSKDTDPGIAVDAMVGKEWWVGADWGIGLAAQLLYMHVQDYTDEAGMDAIAVNVLFTATYN